MVSHPEFSSTENCDRSATSEQTEAELYWLRQQVADLERENQALQADLQACQESHFQENVHSNRSSTHRLLAATAQVANALLTIAPFNQAVNTALQIIGEALETDRVCFVETVNSRSDSAFPDW